MAHGAQRDDVLCPSPVLSGIVPRGSRVKFRGSRAFLQEGVWTCLVRPYGAVPDDRVTPDFGDARRECVPIDSVTQKVGPTCCDMQDNE
jgi:hypothetical protein